MPARVGRRDYAATSWPRMGDKVRLADAALAIEEERDLTGPPGETV